MALCSLCGTLSTIQCSLFTHFIIVRSLCCLHYLLLILAHLMYSLVGVPEERERKRERENTLLYTMGSLTAKSSLPNNHQVVKNHFIYQSSILYIF